MPRSRSVSLSRSNIRSKASSDGASWYPATLVRTCSFVIRPGGVDQGDDEVEQALGGGDLSGHRAPP